MKLSGTRSAVIGPPLSLRPGYRKLGDFAVTELLRVDENARTLYFLADGREKVREPCFDGKGFDCSGLKLPTVEDANHEVTFSPSGRFFVDKLLEAGCAVHERIARRRWKPVGDC
jgi:hypothetical protein